jgi:hypothetical protein
MQMNVNDPRLAYAGFVTIYFGWTILPFPLSAFLDFSVWEFYPNDEIKRSAFMKPVASDTYVSKQLLELQHACALCNGILLRQSHHHPNPIF